MTPETNKNNDSTSQEIGDEVPVDNLEHVEPSTHSGDTAEEQMQFIDSIDDDEAGVYTNLRSSAHDSLQVASLKEFLSRPILAYTYVWNQTGFTNVKVNPWLTFFQNTHIKRKLDNFAFIQSNLKAKIIVNASPFMYGALMVSYRPLPSFTCDVPLTQTSTAYGVNSTFNISCVPQSQTPHILVLPQNNAGGEITMPWFYHKNWLDVTSATDLTNMGALYFQELVPLRSANNTTTFDLTISVYLMADNVHVTGTTTKLAAQSGKRPKSKAKVSSKAQEPNEWAEGPVQKVASTVADIAGRLTTAPVIGVFAKATEMGAKAVSGIASLFGWSNPPVISNVMPMKNLPFHNLASTQVSEPGTTLTFDPKAEMTVDPRSVDLPPIDEMDINYLCGKESLLTHFMWADTDPVNTSLFNARVQPNLADFALVSNTNIDYTIYASPPLGHIARLFQFWRGDIIFRFKAICTQYHKGRVAITWDPLYDVASNTDVYTTSFNQVVDLAPDLDISVRIPYLQARQMLSVSKDYGHDWGLHRPSYGTSLVYSPVSLAATGVFNNGMISMKIINELNGPEDDTQVAFLVYISAADNIEFSNPTPPVDNKTSVVKPQSLVRSKQTTSLISPSHSGGKDEKQLLNYIGESVKSVRTVLRRQVLERIVLFNAAQTLQGFYQRLSTAFTKWPKSGGYVSTGPHSAQSIADSTTFVSYDYIETTPFAWIVPCYVGMRGTIRRSFNVDTIGAGSDILNSMKVLRRNTTQPNGSGRSFTVEVTEWVGTTMGLSEGARRLLGSPEFQGYSGMALTNQRTQTGMTVELPHYYPFKFCATDPKDYPIGRADDDTLYHHYSLEMRVNPTTTRPPNELAIEFYTGIGTDFTTFFFLNVPFVYVLAELPAPQF